MKNLPVDALDQSAQVADHLQTSPLWEVRKSLSESQRLHPHPSLLGVGDEGVDGLVRGEAGGGKALGAYDVAGSALSPSQQSS